MRIFSLTFPGRRGRQRHVLAGGGRPGGGHPRRGGVRHRHLRHPPPEVGTPHAAGHARCFYEPDEPDQQPPHAALARLVHNAYLCLLVVML